MVPGMRYEKLFVVYNMSLHLFIRYLLEYNVTMHLLSLSTRSWFSAIWCIEELKE